MKPGLALGVTVLLERLTDVSCGKSAPNTSVIIILNVMMVLNLRVTLLLKLPICLLTKETGPALFVLKDYLFLGKRLMTKRLLTTIKPDTSEGKLPRKRLLGPGTNSTRLILHLVEIPLNKSTWPMKLNKSRTVFTCTKCRAVKKSGNWSNDCSGAPVALPVFIDRWQKFGDDNRNILCKLWGISLTEANTWIDSAVAAWKQKDADHLGHDSEVLKLVGPNGQLRMLEIMDRPSMCQV